MTLSEAIAKLKSERPDSVVVCYWDKGDSYVLHTATEKGFIGCSYFVVNNNGIIGTNPIREKLIPKEAKFV